MNLKFRKKRYFALAGNKKSTILAEIIKMPSPGKPAVQVLAETEGAMDQQVTLNRLLATIPNDLNGNVSIVLPLDFFDIVTVSLPITNEEAISKALPYHLAKAVPAPLSEFIYDWHITRRQKESIETTVYLFPILTFEKICWELKKKKLEVKFMEADIFAAFAFMSLDGNMKEGETTLCAIIWPESLSMAIYQGGQIKLVRRIPISQPEEEFRPVPANIEKQKPQTQFDQEIITESEETSEIENNIDSDDDSVLFEDFSMPGDQVTDEDDGDTDLLAEFSLVENHSDEDDVDRSADILAAFSVFFEDDPPATSPQKSHINNEDATEEDPDQTLWTNYLHNLSLEIIRTRDYYGSIVKGDPIKSLVVEGADLFWDDLRDITMMSLGIEMRRLKNKTPGASSAPTLHTMCIGTGARW